MLKRKIYDDLVAWKQRSGGTTALLIDGARRVGKSFIAKEFAENEYKSHIIIDFGNVPKDVLDIFENDSTDLDMFFAKLSVFFGVQLYNRESLIVFDEVQQFPRARQIPCGGWPLRLSGNRLSHPAQEERQGHYHPIGGGTSGDVPLGL